jgi:hypothetical protein
MSFDVVGPGVLVLAVGAVLFAVLGSVLPLAVAVVVAAVLGWTTRGPRPRR